MARARFFLRTWVAPVLILLGLPVLPAVVAGLAHPKAPAWKLPELGEGELLLKEVLAWPKDSYIWVDARSEEVFAKGHTPGALPLNESSWDTLLFQNLETFSGGKKLVVYCDSRQCDASKGVRERLLADKVATEVYILHGGWQELEKSALVREGSR